MKEVKKHVWVVKCEEFCTTLPNCGRSCRNNRGACSEAGCSDGCSAKCNPCAALENRCVVPPKCGKMRSKKTLEKKIITCKVPVYKCIVVYSCSNCSPSQESAVQSAAPLPPVVGASYER